CVTNWRALHVSETGSDDGVRSPLADDDRPTDHPSSANNCRRRRSRLARVTLPDPIAATTVAFFLNMRGEIEEGERPWRRSNGDAMGGGVRMGREAEEGRCWPKQRRGEITKAWIFGRTTKRGKARLAFRPRKR
ncbi:hypothetical protein BHE74_00023603, partial [Ensete ventricosum]